MTPRRRTIVIEHPASQPHASRVNISPESLAQMWMVEVPKVVARHEEERQHLRHALGLARRPSHRRG